MMKEEFIRRLNWLGNHLKYDDLPDEVYRVIEFVYNYHPTIQEKDDIARIYNFRGGFQIILDMVPTAKYWQEREKELAEVRSQIAELQKKVDKYNEDYRSAANRTGI